MRVPRNPAPIAVSLEGVDCAETKAKCILSALAADTSHDYGAAVF
ncbi:hypothetical protein SM11_chr0722 [Sinorhizobium meliloti SM11]|uniref:Uncharacterized protein n=1 Tax=Sinorhizobium meliloti (strain SM11) TaxID=707241 RepID=F7X0L4_SINMM|nr:hypothetical protein SM11_chr0722 [Sinorhizobium meliloti SM11]